MTTQIDHNAEKSRSYTVRQALPGHVDGHDWSEFQAGTSTVYMVARRAICRVEAGERIRLVSTSNAGFRGIEGLGLRDGQPGYVHMGSLGAWDAVA